MILGKYLLIFIVLFALLTDILSFVFIPSILNGVKRSRKVVICRNPSFNFTSNLKDNEFGDGVLRCERDEVIKINSAVFGIKQPKVCPNLLDGEAHKSRNNCDEVITTKSVVKNLCENRRKCKIIVRDTDIPVHCETDPYQALIVTYSCSSSYPIIRHPFSNSQNALLRKQFYTIR